MSRGKLDTNSVRKMSVDFSYRRKKVAFAPIQIVAAICAVTAFLWTSYPGQTQSVQRVIGGQLIKKLQISPKMVYNITDNIVFP
jgi:hypothetical protein